MDEEDKELERFEPNRNRGQHDNDNGKGKSSNHQSNNNYSGNQNRKRKPDNTVAALQGSSKGSDKKKSERTPFIELLKKQCP